MDLTKTGKLIAQLRLENKLTQKDVANALGISAKTISKWENGKGFPDISLISGLSELFRVDISKLLAGELPNNKKEAGQMKKTKFYVCEKCGNILTSLGDSEIVCCGRNLSLLVAKNADQEHQICVEKIEDDYYVTFNHPMTKEHYISFAAYVRFDRVLTLKLYPEQASEVRFPLMRGGKFIYFCNTHGLFEQKL